MAEVIIDRVRLRMRGPAPPDHIAEGLANEVRASLGDLDLTGFDPAADLVVGRMRLDLGRLNLSDRHAFRRGLAGAMTRALSKALEGGAIVSPTPVAQARSSLDPLLSRLAEGAAAQGPAGAIPDYLWTEGSDAELATRELALVDAMGDPVWRRRLAALADTAAVTAETGTQVQDPPVASQIASDDPRATVLKPSKTPARPMAQDTRAPDGQHPTSTPDEIAGDPAEKDGADEHDPSAAEPAAAQEPREMSRRSVSEPTLAKEASERNGQEAARAAVSPSDMRFDVESGQQGPRANDDRQAPPENAKKVSSAPTVAAVVAALAATADALALPTSALRDELLPQPDATAPDIARALRDWAGFGALPAGRAAPDPLLQRSVGVLAEAILQAVPGGKDHAAGIAGMLSRPPLRRAFNTLITSLPISTSGADNGTAADVVQRREDLTRWPMDAGVILLWPFLKQFLTGLETVPGSHSAAAAHAAFAIRRLAGPIPEEGAAGIGVSRLLAGLAPDAPLPERHPEGPQEAEDRRALLSAAMEHWGALGATTPASLQEAFLLRPGKLTQDTDGWHLKVEKAPYDLLLARLPWQMSVVRLQWMTDPIMVEWT